jgi:predicted esterase YcpF (UPF0227 family)
MIIYIHGFGGTGKGVKATAFRNYFSKQKISFIAPSLSYVPDLAIATLEELISTYDEPIHFIGSSLGGFYALYLSQKYHTKAVLINPSIYPYETLSHYIGDAKNFYDDSTFAWQEQHITMLHQYEIDHVDQKNILLMVQEGDQTLNFQKAINFLPDAKIIREKGGSHSFDGIEEHFERVLRFFEV